LKSGAPAFGLKLDAHATPSVSKLTAPTAAATDHAKASQLTRDLARLEAVQHVNDPPKPEDRTKHGLDNPRHAATLAMSDEDAHKYGFEKPALKVAVKYKESKPATEPPKDEPVTKTITVGKVVDDATKGRYATLGENGAVFVVPEPFVKAVDKPALELLEKSL